MSKNEYPEVAGCGCGPEASDNSNNNPDSTDVQYDMRLFKRELRNVVEDCRQVAQMARTDNKRGMRSSIKALRRSAGSLSGMAYDLGRGFY